ncbi:Molybdenum cofactor biosynthesis, MoeB [Pseudocohnilembus persalinus]|uniref:Molybdenum cofactor biosynthesis, MoeB n=1 Tax=Pseudocohnilembus persalinus TaxID=266149 RepID=A0A0V0QFT8_PSEPJ|nr:Molybdenum cofactor biosynthesis, MoeB [Pseudocohnilembus persalinus]|eukprot:KRX01060.1 Molybdenum cofactor biosynthesis, MoeB [Pseudocohnilembus persalinus]
MYIAEERNLTYNPFQHNEEVYQQIISIIDEIYPNLKQDQKNTIQQFVKFFGIDYCPVYSVIGSIASQEFIKVIGKGYGKLENIQGAKNYKRQDLPELTRKKEI